MANGLDIQKLDSVFKSRPDILQDIHKAADSPSRVQLFNKIANFIYEQTGDHTDGSSLKRRRVDIEPSQNGNQPHTTETSTAEDVSNENILLEIKDISVSIPQRKKFELCFTPKHLYARIPGATTPAPGIVYAWKDIAYAFYLPVPEKSQIQHNYVLFPRNALSLSKSGTPTEDPLLFTVSAGAPKPGSIGGPNAGAASAVSDTYTTLFNWALNKCLQAAGNNVQIVAADPTKFHSKVRQPHRPKEAAVHVKAFRGSKDGYLFFLENGILWGFKKPLLFIPLDKIAAISYTSVLQRTFNMVVEVFTGENGDETTEEMEFSMLDQEDYGGINEDYVMRHRLQDRSMADQRKAKRELAENAKGKKDPDAEGEEANGQTREDGMTELERAQMEAEQQLQDEEDEDEEDYDPGSEGESEGSGTSSEEDDDDDDDDAAEDDEMDEDENLGEEE